MYLFTDTETTGRWLKDKPPQHPEQPRIVQLGMILATPELRVVAEWNTLVKQTFIEPEAQQVHGITVEQTQLYGIDEKIAIAVYDIYAIKAAVFVGHNADFDCNVLHAAYHRHGIKTKREGKLERFCTMLAMTPICKLPKPYQGDASDPYKYPRLGEAFKFCFGTELSGGHDAMKDIRGTMQVFQWWKENVEKAQIATAQQPAQ